MNSVVKKFELEIAFRSWDYSDSFEIDRVVLELSDKDISNINQAQEFIKTNGDIHSVKVDINGSVAYERETDEEGVFEEFDGWKTDTHSFVVYDNTVYYYAQNKYHSGDQIESEGFSI
jgi:hypothetical protein